VSTGTVNEIREGSLTCDKCGQVYPIVRYVPRFIASDLYTRSFSVEWNIFSRTQLDRGPREESRKTFVEKTGFSLAQLKRKTILDAGCGMGRFSEIASRVGSATVVGMDLSRAVDAAYANIGSRKNVHIVQADISNPPFLPESFDVIFSIGVLHHSPRPKEAFGQLTKLLKKQGSIAIWVYPKFFELSDLYRVFTSRLPWQTVLALSRLLVLLYPMAISVPYFSRLVPISTHPNYEWRLLDTFDWYSPRYQHKFHVNEVIQWFREMKLRDVRVLPIPVSVSGNRFS